MYCERYQHRWEEYLQPAVYAHNSSPIFGLSAITHFFLVFGREAPSPEKFLLNCSHIRYLLIIMRTISFQKWRMLTRILAQSKRIYVVANANFMTQRLATYIFCILDGKIVYLRKGHVFSSDGKATRFIRNFDGPFIVTGHPYERSNLLTLRNAATGQDFSRPVNKEKVVVIPDQVPDDLRLPYSGTTICPTDPPTLSS